MIFLFEVCRQQATQPFKCISLLRCIAQLKRTRITFKNCNCWKTRWLGNFAFVWTLPDWTTLSATIAVAASSGTLINVTLLLRCLKSVLKPQIPQQTSESTITLKYKCLMAIEQNVNGFESNFALCGSWLKRDWSSSWSGASGFDPIALAAITNRSKHILNLAQRQ